MLPSINEVTMIKNVLMYLEKHANNIPDKLAFADVDKSYTYKELTDTAKVVGTSIYNKVSSKGSVLVYMKKGADNFAAFFGAVYAGCIYIPIDHMMPVERINKIAATVNPVMIIYDDKTAKNVDSIEADCVSISFDEVIKGEANEELIDRIRVKSIDTDPLYMLFTSGSTGTPKGVVVCHRSVIDYADWLCDEFGFDENTVFGNQTPFYFSMSVLDIYATLASGGTLWVIPKKNFSFPVRLIEFLNDKKVNTIYWVPSALSIVANIGALDVIKPELLDKILFAGEVMPTKQLNIWRRALPNAMYANLFGPTEITDIGVFYVLDREFADDEPIPIGKACDNVDLLVVDEDGKCIDEKEVGRIGELFIRGSYLAFGYYNNPEKTNEAFVQNPVNTAYPEIVYKTGDLVYYNEYGELVYKSRKDFQIKHMGNRIELGEIEVALSSIEGINSCCVLYNASQDRIVAVYAGNAEEEVLREVMAQKVPRYMRPDLYHKLMSLPLNSNGKIDRVKLNGEYA